MTKCILVIGTPRSGSSCVAGILHRLNVRMTLDRFPEPNVNNPTGFYEDIDFVSALLAAKNGDAEPLSLAVTERCNPGILWGAKSFLVVYSLSTIISKSSMPVKVIRMIRPTADSVQSWESKLDDGSWIYEVANKIEETCEATNTPILNVVYSDLLNDPENGVKAIADFVGVEANSTAISFVDSSLRSV